MRSGGGYTLHQSLTIEAASMVKQSVNLARRRGHAQVTPLHVAISMLSSPTSLLKRACLKSHSHPLQCKALELCFNVALNRLPTSSASASSTPLHVGPHPHLPSLSNALVAAFKRAQAHQRRGSIENQQQPILALKVEIEQLVISILDDPSVSRVMREAGFSSTQVKSNVEQSVSVITKIPSEKISTSISTTSCSHLTNATSVLEAMMNKKTRNTVIVCDSKARGEGLVKEVIEKFDRRDVPSEMKLVQFISVPLFTLRNISKEEFEVKLLELRSLVRSYVSRGVVLYLGDLDRVSEFWSEYYNNNNSNNGVLCQLYNPMEYMVMEISRLICGGGDDDQISRRVWLMGVATFQTYAKCKIGRPSLEILWNLYPLTISGSSNLGLGLSLDSGMHDEVKKEGNDGIIEKQLLVCCPDCTKNFAKEKCYFINGGGAASCSSLPSWLQHYKDNENRQLLQVNNQKECDEKIKHLCKKWNSICGSIHAKPRRIFDLSPSSSSTSLSSSNNKKPEFHKKAALFDNWPVIFERNETEVVSKPPPKPDLLSNPNSSPNSASSSEASGRDDHLIMELFPRNKSTEYSDSHENILCGALEKKVPWQKRVIPDIVSTILKCRSGIKTSINNIPVNADQLFRQESWLFFLGSDNGGKEAIARELAKTVFGSQNEDDNFVATSSTTTTRAESASDDQEVMSKSTKKRARDVSNNENGGSVIYERFLEAVRLNPSRVFYVEDVDKLDRRSLKGFEKMMRDGSVVLCDGEVVLLKDAIVVLSCEKFVSFEEEEEDRENSDDDDESKAKKKTKKCGVPLDLNIATEDGILDLVDLQIVLNNPGLANSMC
ncbi:hypothetical protein ABFS82_06G083600 [Erythranthe guttata]|uniref:uncharacterized protein LOC105977943 n=1 Tax=Erythranthe guttata TaxID=4155 RepID=UPI00064DAB5B|nr:PREDICTED: uncharacterized protein LOC105977943 [Erythranthe guttata]|eukprot:XP_012858798.1 PREDICTED: uncharacterized protein LOC105977943 [Erythranthe guttata]